jgi:O-glycosyl hydrolase
MNEPTCPASDSGLDCWDALYRWAEATSREIKRLDPNHLVAVGTQNAGFDDQAGGVFRRVHALDTIDLVSVHRSAGGLPEKELALAHELGKPVYFGEVYLRGLSESCQPLPDGALEQRAQAVADDLQGSLAAGVDGYLLWQYAYGGVDMGSHIEYFCGVYDYFSDDPVWDGVMAREVISSTAGSP